MGPCLAKARKTASLRTVPGAQLRWVLNGCSAVTVDTGIDRHQAVQKAPGIADETTLPGIGRHYPDAKPRTLNPRAGGRRSAARSETHFQVHRRYGRGTSQVRRRYIARLTTSPIPTRTPMPAWNKRMLATACADRPPHGDAPATGLANCHPRCSLSPRFRSRNARGRSVAPRKPRPDTGHHPADPVPVGLSQATTSVRQRPADPQAGRSACCDSLRGGR